MQKLVLYATLAFTFSSCALAQSMQNFAACNVSQSKLVGITNGVEVRRVSISENRADYGATVFLPASNEPMPGILFSHSGMKGTEGRADLLRFAYALARAGGASIVLDGEMSWNRSNPDKAYSQNYHSPHLLACAGQWLLTNASLDRDRLAVAGYMGQWGGGETPICMPGEDPCWNGSVYLNFGESANHETGNTKQMFTNHGRLKFANFATRHLRLSDIQAAWLEEAVQPKQTN